MSESCPVLTPAERQVQDILQRTESAMVSTIFAALERASKQAADELQSIGSVAHQQLFLLLCGADLETFEGGDPEVARHIIQNAQNISDHYWK